VDIGEEEVVSSLLYPKVKQKSIFSLLMIFQVFDDYMTWLQKYGWKVFHINSEAFFFGMKIGQEITVDIPNEESGVMVNSSTLSPILTLPGNTHSQIDTYRSSFWRKPESVGVFG